MAGEVSKKDQALVRGAQLVGDARGELEQQLAGLRGQLAGLGAQWIGSGSAAFQQVMARWDSDTRRILQALMGFESNLRGSDAMYNSSDSAQAQSFSRLSGRLG